MEELFKRLNINPKELKYYNTAFCHSSYVNENHLKSDYERLEFLGDAVLELVMSDYLYREIVAQRIGTLIKNPPRNAHPNDILMLKRWRSRWLYLASVACLRDFLTRISLRLSN